MATGETIPFVVVEDNIRGNEGLAHACRDANQAVIKKTGLHRFELVLSEGGVFQVESVIRVLLVDFDAVFEVVFRHIEPQTLAREVSALTSAFLLKAFIL